MYIVYTIKVVINVNEVLINIDGVDKILSVTTLCPLCTDSS